jgi:23S rRNA pseudouridine1911/1915/1917 synthase
VASTLLDWLIIRFPTAKRQTLKRMLLAGRLRVNGRRALQLKQPLKDEDLVEVMGRDAARGSAPANRLAGLIYEDADLLVVDKPAGLLTSTVPRERRPTLIARVREYVERSDPGARVGLIHRLDQDASGLLIFSKNDQAYQSLKSQFYHHTVKREYRAVVHGIPDPAGGRIATRLTERADGTVHSTRQHGKGDRAITEYEVILTEGKLSLLRVLLHTGRKHQIRVHLRERGTPVMGDRLYGPEYPASRLMLVATRLTVRHPRTGDELTFTAPLPLQFPLRDDRPR